ncbi:MAG: 50S ribosomal protein L35 [Candidatus Kapaibacteriales bacterium]
MPKMKSNAAAKKRFKKTASGLFKREKAFKSHILTKKTRKRKRNLRQAAIVSSVDQPKIARLLPYA